MREERQSQTAESCGVEGSNQGTSWRGTPAHASKPEDGPYTAALPE